MWKIFNCCQLWGQFFGHTGLKTSVFPFHPKLFQVKSHVQKEQFCTDILLPPGKKPVESEIVFQQDKSTLHLDRTAQTQVDTPLGCDVPLCLNPFLPKGFLQNNGFRLVWVLCPAALRTAGTAGAVFTAIPGGCHKLVIFSLCTLSPEEKLPALCAGKRILLRVIVHILHPAKLFPEFLFLFLVVVGGFYKTGLAVGIQMSAPVIKCKKTPRKKCSFVAERRKKDRLLNRAKKALERSQEMKGAQWMDIRSDRQKGLSYVELGKK